MLFMPMSEARDATFRGDGEATGVPIDACCESRRIARFGGAVVSIILVDGGAGVIGTAGGSRVTPRGLEGGRVPPRGLETLDDAPELELFDRRVEPEFDLVNNCVRAGARSRISSGPAREGGAPGDENAGLAA